MKSIIPFLTTLFIVPVLSFSIHAQSVNIRTGPPSSGYMDNALNYSRLLKEQTGDGVFMQVGTFKVTGTPYLYGQKNEGDLFSKDVKAYNLKLSYNTYNQELGFYSTANPNEPLVKEAGEVDSFLIHPNVEAGISSRLKFVYGSLLGSKEKAYFQEIYSGEKYSVYKKYKSELSIVSTNYTQSELREFELIYEYFYRDNAKNSLTKLKTNAANIIKELKKIKDISPVFNYDDFSRNQEQALRKAFVYLNE